MKPKHSVTCRVNRSPITYLSRVATCTVRALNGVSQLVLMCASTPEAVRNCRSAMSSRAARAFVSCGCTSTISEPVNQRMRSMSCTARSMTTPTFDMRGGNGPTRVIAIDRISSAEIACLIACTVGLKRSTWPPMSFTPLRRAAATIWRPSSTVGAIGFSTRRSIPASMQSSAIELGRWVGAATITASSPRPISVLWSATASQWSALAIFIARLRSGSAMATSSTPGSSASTRAWFEPMTPTPIMPKRRRSGDTSRGFARFEAAGILLFSPVPGRVFPTTPRGMRRQPRPGPHSQMMSMVYREIALFRGSAPHVSGFQAQPRRQRVVAERLYAIERKILGGLASERGELLQDVGGCRDDVAAHAVGLDHVPHLAGRRPDDLDLLGRARHAHRRFDRGRVIDAEIGEPAGENRHASAGSLGKGRGCTHRLFLGGDHGDVDLHALAREHLDRVVKRLAMRVDHRQLHIDVLAEGGDHARLGDHLLDLVGNDLEGNMLARHRRHQLPGVGFVVLHARLLQQ